MTSHEVLMATKAKLTRRSVKDIIANPRPIKITSKKAATRASNLKAETVYQKTGNRGAPTLQGVTTMNANHHHKYKLDSKGNGWTMYAAHPDSGNVRHRHRVINWVVQTSNSPCYPNCKRRFGVDGAPPHIHYTNRSTANKEGEY